MAPPKCNSRLFLREIAQPPASYEAETTRVNKDENRKRKLFLYPCCLYGILRRRKRESRRQASETQGQKSKGDIFLVGRTTWKFCSDGEKMKNPSGHQGESEREWKEKGKRSWYTHTFSLVFKFSTQIVMLWCSQIARPNPPLPKSGIKWFCRLRIIAKCGQGGWKRLALTVSSMRTAKIPHPLVRNPPIKTFLDSSLQISQDRNIDLYLLFMRDYDCFWNFYEISMESPEISIVKEKIQYGMTEIRTGVYRLQTIT